MAALDQRSSQLRLDVASHLERRSWVETASKVKYYYAEPSLAW